VQESQQVIIATARQLQEQGELSSPASAEQFVE
jgi:flagellar motor switch protein FliG